MYCHNKILLCLWHSKFGPKVSMVSFVGNIFSNLVYYRLAYSSSNVASISKSASVKYSKPFRNEGITNLFFIFSFSPDYKYEASFFFIGENTLFF